ncbi:DUF4111 domain-containing protein [Paenibacillus alvei]|nr:DUF4111 domain-containing protein [Paenibacillus alvei]
MDSIMADINGAFEEIAENPVYYVLNLSRVLWYVRESVISSKKEAGEWTLHHFPSDYHSLIAQCLAKYRNELEDLNLDETMLFSYTEYMLKEIQCSNSEAASGKDER